MTKPSWRNLPTPQLLQPRTMRLTDSEICATLLKIAPIGQYSPEIESKRQEKTITMADAERIIKESAAWEVPPYRRREWAQRVARDAAYAAVRQQSGG